MSKDLITGAEAMMRSLEHQGVTTIFGYPGGSIMPTFDALYDHQNTLNHILVRHEQGAAHAAQGYARVSGKVGVCLVTSGPGATNTITGIADAMIDSTPIVVIAGQVGTGFLGTDAFQEATTCLRQAKVLADTDRQKQIEARIQEVQKESSQGCLFPETDTQPLPQQPPANGTANGNRPDGQMRMFTSQPPQQPVQQAIPQTVQQPVPRPQIVQPQPVPQYYPGTPQPVPLQPQATVIQTTRENTGREYQSPPQPATEALTFDKDDENDRELLREDPYAEYIDFPQECRMKDETQAELICC